MPDLLTTGLLWDDPTPCDSTVQSEDFLSGWVRRVFSRLLRDLDPEGLLKHDDVLVYGQLA